MTNSRRTAFLGALAALFVAEYAHADSAPQASSTSSGITLYLNGDGIRLHHGPEDSRKNLSAALAMRNLDSLDVPRFHKSAATWQKFTRCVQEQLASFRVKVVLERPASGDYIMAAVGGRPGLLGFKSGVSGIAAFNGRINRNGVIFVFAREMNGVAKRMCGTTLQEFGHALGLDHTLLAGDAMSYLPSRSRKAYLNVDAKCGEKSARTCITGAATQNSYRALGKAVGFDSSAKPSTGSHAKPTTGSHAKPAPAPAHKAPAHKAPAHKAPAHKAPAHKAPAHKAPAHKPRH